MGKSFVPSVKNAHTKVHLTARTRLDLSRSGLKSGLLVRERRSGARKTLIRRLRFPTYVRLLGFNIYHIGFDS